MRRGRILSFIMLAAVMLMGIPSYAQEGDPAPEVAMTIDTAEEDGVVNAGDTLQFTLTAANPGGSEDLGGAFLRFCVSETEDMSSRIGSPQIQTKSEYLSDPSNGNGIAALRVSRDITGTAEAVVSLAITEDMKGKTLYFQTDLRPDFAEADPFAQTGVMSVQVADDSEPSGNADLRVGALLNIDIEKDQIVKEEAVPAELLVTNTGDVPLEYIYVSIGYSRTGIENDEAGMMPIGTFTDLPENVTQPEDGVACIASLGAGETVTLPAYLTVPESYSDEDIVFTFMAVSYGTEEFEETDVPLAFGYVEMGAKVSQDTAGKPGENPDPGTGDPVVTDPKDPAKDLPADTKKTEDAKKTEAKSAQAPQTGDTALAAGVAVLMLGAVMVMGVTVRRKYK